MAACGGGTYIYSLSSRLIGERARYAIRQIIRTLARKTRRFARRVKSYFQV